MSFKIPPQAFLSFGRKQAVNALWRFGRQIEEALQKKKNIEHDLSLWKGLIGKRPDGVFA